MIHLEANLGDIQGRIVASARRSGRHPAEITLVAVTKTQPVEAIKAAYDLGLRHFGENRVEEAELRVPLLPADVTWHMIGHIQSRKAKRVLPLFQFVQSVDSFGLALRLSDLSAGRFEKLPVLLECNVSGEAGKFGLAATGWAGDAEIRNRLCSIVADLVALPNLDLQGLMTMAPVVRHPEEARAVFRQLRLLRNELASVFPGTRWQHLSMGMTDDFEVAIEEGATIVRLGRAVFAPRVPSPRTA